MFGGFEVDPNVSSKHYMYVGDLYVPQVSDLSRSLVKEKKEAKFLILSPSEKCQKVV